MEVGLYKTLIGTPTTRNLAISLWGEAYLFSPNHDSAYVTPTVFANNIPPAISVHDNRAVRRDQPGGAFERHASELP